MFVFVSTLCRGQFYPASRLSSTSSGFAQLRGGRYSRPQQAGCGVSSIEGKSVITRKQKLYQRIEIAVLSHPKFCVKLLKNTISRNYKITNKMLLSWAEELVQDMSL